jgi:hypothetical protein
MQKLIVIVEDSKNVFFSSKFPLATERISWKFIDNLGKRPHKGLLALSKSLRFQSVSSRQPGFMPNY